MDYLNSDTVGLRARMIIVGKSTTDQAHGVCRILQDFELYRLESICLVISPNFLEHYMNSGPSSSLLLESALSSSEGLDDTFSLFILAPV